MCGTTMELFHRLIDPECAEVRRFISEDPALSELVNFRNIDISESALASLKKLTAGSVQIPCLKTATQHFIGSAAILKHLMDTRV